MLMYCEVFVVHFLWRSQHEQLWKDYREYTLKDISSATKHYFSQVLLLLSKFCEFLFGGVTYFLALPCPILSSPLLGQPQSQAAYAFEELWSQLVTLSFQEQEWLLWDLLHNEEVLFELHYFPTLFFLHCSSFFIFLLWFFPFLCFCYYCFRFLIMYSTHTTGCQFDFVGQFKGQINLCFYKEKIKDQLSWPSIPICYLSLQSSYASLEKILPLVSAYRIFWHIVVITHLPVNTLALNEQSNYFISCHCLIYALRSY